jgi:hypothetical protein
LHTELRRRREAQDDGDYSAQGRMKRRRVIPSDIEGEFSKLEEGRNPEKSLGKPKKKRSPVKVKVEIKEGMQEAQGPDTTMSEKDQEETSSKPSPTGQTSKIPEEPITTAEGLDRKEPEEGKL